MPNQMTTQKTNRADFWPHFALHRGLTVAILLMLYSPMAALAMSANPSALCDAAAKHASDQTGVPLDVLRAISIVETGRPSPDGFGLQAWPWAFNHAGEGQWFDTPDEAMHEAAILIDQGVRNIDLGCFQLNLRWHSKAFSGLDAMFDPDQNAVYAAEFLKNQYEKSGNWSDAAGAYHSLTPAFAQDYRKKFDEVLASLESSAPDQIDAPQIQDIRTNNFPLLLAGARGNGGSLVPRQDRARPLIGAP